MWWVVLGVHVDMHGEWVMLWVVAMYNVLAILSKVHMVCLAETVESMSSVGSVWYVLHVWHVWYMVCMICLSYAVKLYCC